MYLIKICSAADALYVRDAHHHLDPTKELITSSMSCRKRFDVATSLSVKYVNAFVVQRLTADHVLFRCAAKNLKDVDFTAHVGRDNMPIVILDDLPDAWDISQRKLVIQPRKNHKDEDWNPGLCDYVLPLLEKIYVTYCAELQMGNRKSAKPPPMGSIIERILSPEVVSSSASSSVHPM